MEPSCLLLELMGRAAELPSPKNHGVYNTEVNITSGFKSGLIPANGRSSTDFRDYLDGGKHG